MPIKVKRPRKLKAPYRRYSFEYVPGSLTDSHLAIIAKALFNDDKAYLARWSVLTCADTMSVESCREVLELLAPEQVDNTSRQMLHVQNLPDIGDLSNALQLIRATISRVVAMPIATIANRKAYEVAIAYSAIRLERILAND